MIRHIVFFSAKRDSDLAAIKDGLMVLGGIPGATHFEVAYNDKLDALSTEIDIVVYVEFPDRQTLEAFKAHALYQESIGKVRHLRDLRFVADFEAAA